MKMTSQRIVQSTDQYIGWELKFAWWPTPVASREGYYITRWCKFYEEARESTAQQYWRHYTCYRREIGSDYELIENFSYDVRTRYA